MERDQEMSGGGERRCLLVSLGEGTLINPFTCCQGILLMVLGNMVISGNLPPGKVIDEAMPLSALGRGNSREQMRLFRMGSRVAGMLRTRGASRSALPGLRDSARLWGDGDPVPRAQEEDTCRRGWWNLVLLPSTAGTASSCCPPTTASCGSGSLPTS